MLLLKVLTNRKAIQSALGLIETIQESSKDGKLNQKERNELTKVFWRLVDDVRGVVKSDKPRRDFDMQEIARAVAKIANNDLPHIENRLHRMDIRLEGMDANISWAGKLLLGLTVAGASLAIGVIITLVF